MSPRDLRPAYPEGTEVRCVVRRVEPFGVFVELVGEPGVNGFIRPREWSWARRGVDLTRVSPVGDRILARVTGYRDQGLELSRRLSLPNPYVDFRRRHKAGDVVIGQVEFVAQKEGGVRLVLDNGAEAFIPRSELPDMALRQEGFGLLAQDWLRARILRFEEAEAILSLKEYLRRRDQVEARDEERMVLRAHPTVGLVLEDLSLNYQLQEIPEPEIPESLRERVRRILIVEDNEGVSESLDLVFEHLRFARDVARSVEEARAKLRESSYDLLILDVNIPGGKGDQLISELRAGARPPYVFVLTAAPEQEWSALVDAGADLVSGFFQKPASALRLMEHLSALIDHRPSPGDDRGRSSSLGGLAFRPEDVAGWRGRSLPNGRRGMIEAYVESLREETNASRAFVLSIRSGSLFERVGGDFVELTREVQQNLDISPVGSLIRRRQFLAVPDVAKRKDQFQHLLRVLPVGSFAGCHLDYRDEAEYGLFLLGDRPNQLRNATEERLRVAASLIGNLIAEEKLETVVTANQGVLLTGFLADSLLHEIKNAVQALDGYSAVQARLAKRHATDFGAMSPAEVVELKRATGGIQGIAGQLNNLVLLFRNLAGAAEIEEINLGSTIRRLNNMIKPLADGMGVVLDEPDVDERIPELQLEPKLLDQALLNVLINAIEQMDAGSAGRRVLRVAAEYHPERKHPVVIAVSDTGPGIHSVHQGRIFDLFFTTKKRGTGLGLYVSRAFIEQVGGQLRLGESFLYAGSTFLVELPRKVLT